MQQLKVQQRKLVSNSLLEKLKRFGKKPLLIEDRFELLAGNNEVAEISASVIRQDSISGAFWFDISAFAYLSELLEHQEIKANYFKLKEVISALNEARPKKKEDKK